MEKLKLSKDGKYLVDDSDWVGPAPIKYYDVKTGKLVKTENRYGSGRGSTETITTTSTLPWILRGWNEL